jgi:hypothetical protein
METDSVSESLSSLVFYNAGEWMKPRNPVILNKKKERKQNIYCSGVSVVYNYEVKF